MDAIKKYRLRKDELRSTEDRVVYFNEPVKDYTRHPADALRHLAMQYRYGVIGGEMLGYQHAIPIRVASGAQRADRGYDRLRWRKRRA